MKIQSKHIITSPLILSITSALLFSTFLFSIFNFIQKTERIEELNTRIILVKKQMLKKEMRIKKEEKILTQISKSNPSYIEECLHSLNFLATERQKWKIFLSQVEPSPSMKERSSFLEDGKNKLEFLESNPQKNELFIEKEARQKNPVEVNEEDLKAILCSIEGVKIHPYIPKEGSPQILIKSLEIEKKAVEETKEQNYKIQMQLIKRQRAL